MTKLAALPNVCCKLSMLGLAVPGWPTDPDKEATLRGLVLETIDLFGAERCMFNSNWCALTVAAIAAAAAVVVVVVDALDTSTASLTVRAARKSPVR